MRRFAVAFAVLVTTVSVVVMVGQSPAFAATPTFKSVSVGDGYACAIKTDNTLWCWGGMPGGFGGPTQIHPGWTWTAVSAGTNAACGIHAGARYCWGQNFWGELGVGDTTNRTSPTRLAGEAANWASVSIGSEHACGVLTNGTGKCWGRDAWGMVGVGNIFETAYSTPQQLVGISFGTAANPPAITANGANFSCGLGADTKRWCWGSMYYDQGSGAIGALGLNPNVDSDGDGIVAFPTNRNDTFSQVTAGNYFGCALGISTRLYCWGQGFNGQLGMGNNNDQTFPTLVSGTNTWLKVSAGDVFTCGVRTNKAGYCWGTGSFGVLGNGNIVDVNTWNGAQLPFLWKDIVGGPHGTCGIRDNGFLYCWGYASAVSRPAYTPELVTGF